jgi:hypothetical protein
MAYRNEGRGTMNAFKGFAESLDWIKDTDIEMLPNENRRGVITHSNGTKTLVVFECGEWMSIPGYFGEEDACN